MILPLRSLIAMPIFAYLFSYAYLAYYHGKSFIFNTVVHEGGTFTLIQDAFYASHFLGHIPVHTTLAFFFTGIFLCLAAGDGGRHLKRNVDFLLIALVFFLVFTFFLSLSVFGYEDTFAYLAQKKQSVARYEQGGSWNLHIPSTTMQFMLIPIYLFGVMVLFRRPVRLSSKGAFYILASVGLFLIFGLYFNTGFLAAIYKVWTDPRYLAHSVRELLTFPVIYYPIPLYFMMKDNTNNENPQNSANWKELKPLKICFVILLVIFVAAFAYQSYIPLTQGISELAQKPAFARGGKLGIPYLLAAHYFEHFLDSIYFSLFCLLLFGAANRRFTASRKWNEQQG